MKTLATGVLTVLLTTGMSWGCGRAPEPVTVAPAEPVQILRQMSDALAQSRQLTFKAARQIDPALSGSGDVPEHAVIDVAISRPNKLQATSSANTSVRRFYADGQTITMLDETMLLYATVPLAGTIDDMLDNLDDTYGFVPPLADFAANDPFRRFNQQMHGSVYQARETVGGVECDHVTMTGAVADADLWISTTDHLPRRFVATFKDREGRPQLKIDFSEWNLAAKLEDSRFAFTPPSGAEKTRMLAVPGQE